MGDLVAAFDCAGNVLHEIFERLGGVAARPQATTARMKHYTQDAATDFSGELNLTKLQYAAFMKEGVPRLRMKAAMTRHLLPVVLRVTEIHFPPRDVTASCTRNSTAGRGSDRGKRGTSHSPSRLRGSNWFLDGRGCSGARSRSITQRITCSIRLGTLHSSAMGWASNVAETVHMSMLPRASIQNEALDTNEALDIFSAQDANKTLN